MNMYTRYIILILCWQWVTSYHHHNPPSQEIIEDEKEMNGSIVHKAPVLRDMKVPYEVQISLDRELNLKCGVCPKSLNREADNYTIYDISVKLEDSTYHPMQIANHSCKILSIKKKLTSAHDTLEIRVNKFIVLTTTEYNNLTVNQSEMVYRKDIDFALFNDTNDIYIFSLNYKNIDVLYTNVFDSRIKDFETLAKDYWPNEMNGIQCLFQAHVQEHVNDERDYDDDDIQKDVDVQSSSPTTEIMTINPNVGYVTDPNPLAPSSSPPPPPPSSLSLLVTNEENENPVLLPLLLPTPQPLTGTTVIDKDVENRTTTTTTTTGQEDLPMSTTTPLPIVEIRVDDYSVHNHSIIEDNDEATTFFTTTKTTTTLMTDTDLSNSPTTTTPSSLLPPIRDTNVNYHYSLDENDENDSVMMNNYDYYDDNDIDSNLTTIMTIDTNVENDTDPDLPLPPIVENTNIYHDDDDDDDYYYYYIDDTKDDTFVTTTLTPPTTTTKVVMTVTDTKATVDTDSTAVATIDTNVENDTDPDLPLPPIVENTNIYHDDDDDYYHYIDDTKNDTFVTTTLTPPTTTTKVVMTVTDTKATVDTDSTAVATIDTNVENDTDPDLPLPPIVENTNIYHDDDDDDYYHYIDDTKNDTFVTTTLTPPTTTTTMMTVTDVDEKNENKSYMIYYDYDYNYNDYDYDSPPPPPPPPSSSSSSLSMSSFLSSLLSHKIIYLTGLCILTLSI
uniref:Uncharacterized protein n=1 Tax=Melicertus latisulcatus majanivirus TaxID=2984277 RepID=A0A9C7CD88_9VIRU|nr:MAG: hypothetical protein [Melicertus latisulcatus majanivirus]